MVIFKKNLHPPPNTKKTINSLERDEKRGIELKQLSLQYSDDSSLPGAIYHIADVGVSQRGEVFSESFRKIC